MKTGESFIPKNSVALLGYLLGTSLESGEETDRLLALAAANAHDRQHATKFGRLMIRRFVKEAGLHLIDPIATHANSRAHELVIATRPVAEAVQQISLAVGPDLVGEVRVMERLTDGSSVMATRSNVAESDHGLFDLASVQILVNGKPAKLAFSDEISFLVAGIGTEAQMSNLSNSVAAVAPSCLTS